MARLRSKLVMMALCLSGVSATHAAPPADVPTAPDGKSTHSLRLMLLGTAGGPVIRLNRHEPSSLLVVDGAPYMIDVGSGWSYRLAAAGYGAQNINALFITHHHWDHDGGLAEFIGNASLAQRSVPVPVIGPLGTSDMVKASVEFTAPMRRIFAAEGLMRSSDPAKLFQARELPPAASPSVIYQDDRIKVTAVENSHFRSIAPDNPSYGRDRSYSFRFDTQAGSIVFSGDTGPSENLVELAKGADILVTEVIDVEAAVAFATRQFTADAPTRARIAEHMAEEHLTPAEVGKLAKRAGVKMVVLTHYSPGSDNDRSTAAYVDGIRAHYRGPVIAGGDLGEINLAQ